MSCDGAKVGCDTVKMGLWQIEKAVVTIKNGVVTVDFAMLKSCHKRRVFGRNGRNRKIPITTQLYTQTNSSTRTNYAPNQPTRLKIDLVANENGYVRY